MTAIGASRIQRWKRHCLDSTVDKEFYPGKELRNYCQYSYKREHPTGTRTLLSSILINELKRM
jgi:hypothetical protein